MLAPTNHSTSMVMSAAPTPMIRQPGLGTSGPSTNHFLSGIQENLACGPPTALSSQFNTNPVSLVPNYPPPTTFSNFAASTPHNKHPPKKKVILPKSNRSSSSETSYHKSENKKKGKGKNLKRTKTSQARFMNRSTRPQKAHKDKLLFSPPLRQHCFPQSQPRRLLQPQSLCQQGHHY